MRKQTSIFLSVLLLAACVHSQPLSKEQIKAKLASMKDRIPSYKPANGFVPTDDVALELAKVILKPILGKDLERELPLRVRRKDKHWIVEGKERFECKTSEPNCFEFDTDPVYLELDSETGAVT